MRGALCLGLAALATALEPADALDAPDALDGLSAEFQHLWDMVVVQQQSRNVPQGEAPTLRRVCQFGLSPATFELAQWMLTFAEPPLEELEINDLGDGMSDMALQLAEAFPGRVRRNGLWKRPAGAVGEDGARCDLVLFSKVSVRFSLDRVMPRLGTHVVAVWVSDECIHETSEVASPACGHLNSFWERTYLMMRGYCTRRICASRVLTSILQGGSNASISEFGQDWFALRNFLGLQSKGVYVDVGASLPFDYSNTVMLDRCLGWQGVCIEPNPHLSLILEAYRSCQVFTNCADEEGRLQRPFADRGGKVEFMADCLPLGEILRRAGLTGRIDLMNIDVEHQELAVLKGLPFQDFDIRVIVIEVTRGARWLEVDSILLPAGYAKVAVLGRDVVYVKLEELWEKRLAGWPMNDKATLPDGWAEFHQRVLDEEMEEEMRQERQAFYAGLRRQP
ncbi:unnamed protein product [Effrenium voratum]|uniref:Methyltransferase FkbM domain-containing protein n=1 Tax=Effrenium voratum TaxID=2562239 RepID=A0AA36N574_9DINO|nr:unnamed protein product [Effrenium voratum]